MGGDERQGNADQRLAANLRTLREGKVMTQAALAEQMTGRGWPWHQSTVYRVETGKQAVRFGEAAALAAILDVPLDRLAWSSPESDATDAVLEAGAELGSAAGFVSQAVHRLLAARDGAQEALDATKDAPWPRVQGFRELIAERLDVHVLEAAVAEGVRRYEEYTGEGGDDDDSGPDEERQP